MPETRASARTTAVAVAPRAGGNQNESPTDGTGRRHHRRNKKGKKGGENKEKGPLLEGLVEESTSQRRESLLVSILPPPTLITESRMGPSIRPQSQTERRRTTVFSPLAKIESMLVQVMPPPTVTLGTGAGMTMAGSPSGSSMSAEEEEGAGAPPSTSARGGDEPSSSPSPRKIVTRSSSWKKGKGNNKQMEEDRVIVLENQDQLVTLGDGDDDHPVAPSPVESEKPESKSSKRRKRMSKKRFEGAAQPDQEQIQEEEEPEPTHQPQEEELEDLSSSSSSIARSQEPPKTPRQRRGPAGNSKKKKQAEAVTTTTTPEPPPLPPFQEENEDPFLPPLTSLPHPTAGHVDQKVRLRSLKGEIREILSEIFLQVQDCDTAEEILCEYKKVARLYDYITEVYWDNPHILRQNQPVLSKEEFRNHTIELGKRYKEMVLETLYEFGPVVWRKSNNPNVEKVVVFLQDCFLRLGWKKHDSDRKGRNKSSLEDGNNYMMTGELEDENYRPASYDAVNLFVKYHAESNGSVRQQQLVIMQKLVAAASAKSSTSDVMLEFLRYVLKNAKTTFFSRLNDRMSMCRALALSTLSRLLIVLGPEVGDDVKNQLMYSTRYDPNPEVRRVGTRELAEVDSLELRFFLRQAFDHDVNVRLEAFLAMGVEVLDQDEDDDGVNEEDGNSKPVVRLLREMDQAVGDEAKLCNRILWGAVYSDARSSKYVGKTLLRKWLKISCDNNLPTFLANLDPYRNLAAVYQIMDLLFLGSSSSTSQEGDSGNRNFCQQLNDQREFVSSIDLTFITDLKVNVMQKQYKNLSIEAVVGWLGLCKASKKLGILMNKIIPNGEEMGELMESMYHCVRLENEDAAKEEMDEDAGPMFCAVVGLELCRYVDWEEASRLHMKGLIKTMLLSPIMDDKIFIVHAIHILYQIFCHGTVTGGDDGGFDGLMLDVFQDVFDARNAYNKERKRRSMMMNVTNEQPQQDNGGADQNIPPTQPVIIEESIMTPSQLLKLKEKICDLASERLRLTLERDALLKDKLHIEALPLMEKIMKLQDQEAMLKTNLNEQKEAIARRERQIAEEKERGVQIVTIKEEVESISYEDGDYSDSQDESEQQHNQNNNRKSSVIITRDDGGVISTVEEGLTRGMVMINTYLDLRADMNPFIRNLYENYASGYLKVDDLLTRTCVLEFMTRVAIMEKKELLGVSHLLIHFLLDEGVEAEIILISFKCLVDLLIFYKWEDFIVRPIGGDEELPYVNAYTKYFQKYLNKPNLTYAECTSEDVKDLFLELLKQFPSPSNKGITPEIMTPLLIRKYQGYLKLFMRGKLRDPTLLSEVFELYVMAEYSGSAVLKDLNSVAKLHRTFEWWEVDDVGPSVVEAEEGEDIVQNGDDGDEEGAGQLKKKKWNEASRVLGIAVIEAVVSLCEDMGEDQLTDDNGLRVWLSNKHEADITTFLLHFMGFLDVRDQPLMRTMVTTLLAAVKKCPLSSYSSILVRAATKIPITNFTSGRIVKDLIVSINEAMDMMDSQPHAKRFAKTKMELEGFARKSEKLFPS